MKESRTVTGGMGERAPRRSSGLQRASLPAPANLSHTAFRVQRRNAGRSFGAYLEASDELAHTPQSHFNQKAPSVVASEDVGCLMSTLAIWLVLSVVIGIFMCRLFAISDVGRR